MWAINRILPRWLTAGQEHKEDGQTPNNALRITKTPHSPSSAARRTLAKPNPVSKANQGRAASLRWRCCSTASVLLCTPCTQHSFSRRFNVRTIVHMKSISNKAHPFPVRRKSWGMDQKTPRVSHANPCRRCAAAGAGFPTTRTCLHALPRYFHDEALAGCSIYRSQTFWRGKALLGTRLTQTSETAAPTCRIWQTRRAQAFVPSTW